jgi:hypothetical protein
VPKGLFSRLIVRLLHFASGVVYWQNGILCMDSSEKALVELFPKWKCISLRTQFRVARRIRRRCCGLADAADIRIIVRGTQYTAELLRLVVETLEVSF